jgi:transposase
VTDGGGVPLAVQVTAGQAHESKMFEAVVEAVPVRSGELPAQLSGDKGYSYPRIRDWLKEHGVGDVIPRRSDQRVDGDEDDFDRETYRRRNVVERCIGWLKECRRIATRFEKLAVNFLAMLKVAMIQRYLRLLDSEPT